MSAIACLCAQVNTVTSLSFQFTNLKRLGSYSSSLPPPPPIPPPLHNIMLDNVMFAISPQFPVHHHKKS